MNPFRRFALACLIGLGVALAPAPVAAANIHGTLKLPVARSRIRVASNGLPEARVPPDQPGDAIVYIEQIPEKLETKLARKAAPVLMGQCYGAFIPRVLVVAAGTTVEFENQDRVYHNAFSVSPPRKFDIGKYAPRDRREVRFDKPGIVKVFCELDPDELGYVCVTPNHAFVRPDADGAFSLPPLPAGDYTVAAWHPRYGTISRTLSVPRHGDVEFALAFSHARKLRAR